MYLAAPPTAPAGWKPTSLALVFVNFVTVEAVLSSKIFEEVVIMV
jgi:hypothetical protein